MVIIIAITLIIGGILLRLLPHLPNFAPITATALFAGVYVKKRYAIVLPLIAMIISDYLLLYVSVQTMHLDFSHIYPLTALFRPDTLFVWTSFVISGLIGIMLRSKKRKVHQIIGASLIASIQFFIITNFGVWATTNMYPHTVNGLIQSYIMGIPFFQGTVLGDMFYTGIFFGSYALATKLSSKSAIKTA